MTKTQSKRQLFYEKTLQLFYKKGFKATTIRDIADNMGFEVANVYNYIDNKEALLKQYLTSIAAEYQNGITNINDSSYNCTEKLKAIISMHVRIASEKPYQVSLLISEYKNLKEPDFTKFIAKRLQYETIVENILADGIKRKEFREHNPKIVGQTLLASTHWLYNWYGKHSNEEINPIEMQKEVTDYLLGGIIPHSN